MTGILIVTGEASGDLHGATLGLAIKHARPDIPIYGVGGPKMEAVGIHLIQGIEGLDAIGMVKVQQFINALKTFFRVRGLLRSKRFDCVVFIDNPGLNLRLASVAAKAGHRVVYYIAPQVWAWRPRRLELISRVVHRMIVILPFEESLYRKAGISCTFVGHPLLDAPIPSSQQRDELRRRFDLPLDSLVLGILPGSREGELQAHLPTMVQAAVRLADSYPSIRCVLAQSHRISGELVKGLLQVTPLDIRVIPNLPNEVMACSDLLFVASGTATLQAALIGIPMIIVYRVSWLTYQLAKRLVKIKHIGLVNLIAGRGIVPELIQHDFTAERLSEEAFRILSNRSLYEGTQNAFRNVREALGSPGASSRAAELILQDCQV